MAPDLDVAAEAAAAIFHGAGEVCNAGSRLLTEDAVYDDVLAKVIDQTAYWQPHDALDEDSRMGPVADRASLERVLGFVADGQSDGARLVAGGRRALEHTGG